jgi:hypothetical protein
MITPRLEASGVPSEEVGVDRVPGDQQLAESLEEGEIAVDLDRQVDVGQVGAGAEQSPRLLRVPEVDQARLIAISFTPFRLAISRALSIRG